jgi:hypothetical protein
MWPKRVEYEAGGRRDLNIFQGPVRDDPVVELTITDPYAAAGERARGCLVEFCSKLAGENRRLLQRVQLTTFDAESAETERPESTQQQYDDMQARWTRTFGQQPRLAHTQKSKRQTRNLHDRIVRARTRSGRTLIWDLGRGIDGVMGTRFSCVVNLTEL